MRVMRMIGRDTIGNLGVILLFIAQCVGCVYFLAAMGMYFLSNQQLNQALKGVAHSDITAFSHRSNGAAPYPNEESRMALRESLSFDADSYAVVSSAYLPASDRPLLVGLGAFGRVFDMGLEGSPASGEAPILLIGASVGELRKEDRILIGQAGELSVAVSGRLPKGCVYFQNAYSVNLDQYVVLLATFEQFETLYPYDIADVMAGYHMIGASEEQALKWIGQMDAQAGFEMRPYPLSEQALSQYAENSSYLRFYLGVYGCSFMFILLGLGVFLNRMVDRNMREYAIHRLYGASLFQILARITGYVALATVIPLFLYPLCVNQRSFERIIPIGAIAGFYIVIVAGLSFGAILRLRKNGMMGMMRRDF